MDNFHENFYDPQKRQLNLSHRNMRTLNAGIIATFAHCTEYLDLSHNRINNMTWVYEFPYLRCLIMDNNRLREAHFENLKRPLTNLETLMLNKNEFSDLKMTADILQRLFPDVEYLSLHDNPMCPDNLLLQPFCEFVPYEYSHYRTVLLKSLPNLKFLDHFSLGPLLHIKPQTERTQINEHQQQHPNCQRHEQVSTSNSKDLWSKVKSFLRLNSYRTTEYSTFLHCASSSHDNAYRGVHSEGNRYITNSDL